MSSASASASSSRSSRTRRSCAAIALMAASGRELSSVLRDASGTKDSMGVGGTEEVADAGVGIGREGAENGGSMGSVSESRLALRDAVDSDRSNRGPETADEDGVGGGGVSSVETEEGVSASIAPCW